MAQTLTLLQLVLPVFLIIGAGCAMRKAGILTSKADESLLGVLVKLFIPCLALDVIIGNEALARPSHLIWPPLAGLLSVAIGVGVCYVAGRIFIRNPVKRGTFAAVTGLQNYAYIPLPLCHALFEKEVTGVLFAFNLGVEVAMWSLVVATIAGRDPARRWWRPLVSPPILSVMAGIFLNLLGAGAWIPPAIDTSWHLLGQCAVPLGLLLTGAMLADYFTPHVMGKDAGITFLAIVLRLGLLPLALIGLAFLLPADPSLKAVLMVQAAMPTAVFPIALTRLYNGDVPTALRSVLATSALGLLTIPLWLTFSLRLLP